MKTESQQCPRGHGAMTLKDIKKTVSFRGVDITYEAPCFVCKTCKMEIASLKQAGAMQKKIADAYRDEVGLLTGEQIKKQRKKLGLTQEALANEMTVGIASIKRWESGIIQSPAMDKALRSTFWSKEKEFNFCGGRALSIPRIKLVLMRIEHLIGQRLLLKTDKFLFAAKYVWYADMLSHRELGKSMTGATYAALPYGPQLNNYRDLIDIIKASNENAAEPLTTEENNILQRITTAFPNRDLVYKAAHKEKIWKNKAPGQIIPYVDAAELTQI